MKWLKRFLPHALFPRFMLIIIVPTVLMQLLVGFIFYHRHWAHVRENMISGVVSEISFITKWLHTLPVTKQSEALKLLRGLYKDITLTASMPLRRPDRQDSKSMADFLAALSHDVPYPNAIHRVEGRSDVVLQIALPEGMLQLTFSRKRFDTPTTYIFILWMMGSTVLLTGIAILFTRTQVRAITELARAAEKFGKGEPAEGYRPRGALEVRKAARALIEMKERIERQIAQRTEILASVSHDLRTPLTRLKLQLAMMPAQAETELMMDDIDDMERTIQEYLDFAKGAGSEAKELINIEALLQQIGKHFKALQITYDLASVPPVRLRPHAMHRALANLFDNASRYASACQVRAYGEGKYVIITLADNGPGIPPAKREAVFQAFYRLDHARNLQSGGAGLGLAIVRDIIHAHGGSITMHDSPLGGVMVRVQLPK